MSSLFPCGGTYCLARQTPIAGTEPASCGVWCYDGLLEGRVLVNDLGYACVCPDQGALGRDWY